MLFLKKKTGFFLLLFTLIVFITAGVALWLRSQGSRKATGSLELISGAVGLSVLLDGQAVGETPIQKQGLEPGTHEVVLGNYRQRIEIAPSLNSKIFLAGSRQDKRIGFSLGYQRLTSASLDNLQIIVSPEDAEIEIDGRKAGVAPKSLRVALGSHRLQVSREGFMPLKIELESRKNVNALLQVNLLKVPFSKIEKTDQVFDLEKSEKTIIPRIITRKEPKFSSALSQEGLKFAPWQKLELFRIKDAAAVSDLVFYFTEFLGFPDLPFCFLISEKGELFEGLGLWNFDFSSFNTKLKENDFPTIEGAICPVGLLSGEPTSSEAISQAIKNLQGFLANPPNTSLKLLNKQEQLVLTAGERRELKLEFQNFSSQVWGKDGARLALVSFDSQKTSAFYSPDWQSLERVGFQEEEMVLPGKTATFILPLQAPFRLGLHEEKFILVSDNDHQRIEDSTFSLKVEVGSGGKPTVKISSTPTGFLNVRAEPLATAKLLGVVYPEEEFLLIEEGSGWVKIKLLDGSLGWVSSQYVKLD